MRAYLSGIVAALVGLVAAFLYTKGRKDANDANELQDHNEYIEARKRMDAAAGISDADIQRWLHARGKYKRNGDL